MITVRRVFERAYGKVPEGATCHSAINYEDLASLHATICLDSSCPMYWYKEAMEWWEDDLLYFTSPNISDRPAESFRGFFGKEYEDALDALIEEVEK